MAEVTDLQIDQGSDFYRTMTIYDTLRRPVILSGYSVECQIRKSAKANAFITMDSQIIDANTGRISIGLSNTLTDKLSDIQIYFFDIEVKSPDNKKYRVLQGRINVSSNITK